MERPWIADGTIKFSQAAGAIGRPGRNRYGHGGAAESTRSQPRGPWVNPLGWQLPRPDKDNRFRICDKRLQKLMDG